MCILAFVLRNVRGGDLNQKPKKRFLFKFGGDYPLCMGCYSNTIVLDALPVYPTICYNVGQKC